MIRPRPKENLRAFYLSGQELGSGPSCRGEVEWHQGALFPRVGFIVTDLSRTPEAVVKFYNGRGAAEQWIKEGKNAVKWTRLSCHCFVDNQVQLQLL